MRQPSQLKRDRLVITGETYGRIYEAVDATQRMTLTGMGGITFPSMQTVIAVRNDSDANVRRGEILAIHASLIDADEEDKFFHDMIVSGRRPASAHKSFAVMLEPTPVGAVGRGCVSGVCPARVNKRSDNDSFAGMKAGSFVLEGGIGGAEIVLIQGGTGEKLAIVRNGVNGLVVNAPVEIGTSEEHEEGYDDEWDVLDQPVDQDGVSLWVQTGTAYFENGDQKLYAYVRRLTFNSNGMLCKIEPEVRVVVDEPEICICD